MTLSIIVISHNQKEQLRRCLDSILRQDLPFRHEVIVSDDASSDGTWELAMEYEASYACVHAYQCNSDDCNPLTTSERSGYNRSNGFLHSTGRYFTHIDADDFYRPGTDCLKRQVELLDSHPQCSMCMQGDWWWKEGDPLDNGTFTYEPHRFESGHILDVDEYYLGNIIVNNGVMTIRRQEGKSAAELYHKWYVDTIITGHYQQYGPIVCLDANDWIYSQSPRTITSSIKVNDRMLLWGLDLSVFSSYLIPGMGARFYSSSYALELLLDAVRVILERRPVSEGIKAFFGQFDGCFLFRAASGGRIDPLASVRLIMIREYLKLLLKRRNLLESQTILRVLDRMCI